MKITVKKIYSVLFIDLFNLIPKFAKYFAISYLGLIFISAIASNYTNTSFGFLSFAVAFVVVILIIIKQVIDSLLAAKDTHIELKEKSIFCRISGLNTKSFSIPISQVSSILVHQSFIEKLFNISRIVIVQIAGTAVVYGFNYEDAVKFSEEFACVRGQKSIKNQ